MNSSPRSRSLAPDLPFKFVGGDLSLDFVNTVDWTPGGLEHDRLDSYERLVEWARGGGVMPEAQARTLRETAARDRRKPVHEAYETARWTRWVLHELFFATAMRRPLPDSAAFCNLLARAREHLDLVPVDPRRRREGAVMAWKWRGLPEEPDSMLWPVVHSAAELLTSPDAARLRMCAGPDCGWLYVDRSRNGLRRWCEMETCGTLAKSRRRAERRHVHRSRRAPRRSHA
jgi:predicted RNA-binding Zn ribbon-like protein